MKDAVNVGMIGTRFMGRAHSNAYLQAARFFELPLTPVLHTVCGRDRLRLEQFAEKWGWKETTTSVEELMGKQEVQLIDICTPNDLHMPPAIAAARAGKHVLCEKPLARNATEAESMYLAVHESGVRNMMVSNYRFLPAIRLAKKIIDEGKLGEIRHFDAVYYQDWLVDPAFPIVWRHDSAASGSGANGDMNAHTVDLARYLVGEIEAVNGFEKKFIQTRPLPDGSGTGVVTTDDAALFIAQFQNGAIGSFRVSRFATGRKNYLTLEIYGSAGSLLFNLERLNELKYFSLLDENDMQGFKTISVTDSAHPYMDAWWPAGHSLGWEHALIHQIKELIDGLAGERTISPTFYDGLKSQEILDAVIASAKNKTWVEINSKYEEAL